MNETAARYSMFTLEQWIQMAVAVDRDLTLTDEQRWDILQKFPSASLGLVVRTVFRNS